MIGFEGVGSEGGGMGRDVVKGPAKREMECNTLVFQQ